MLAKYIGKWEIYAGFDYPPVLFIPHKIYEIEALAGNHCYKSIIVVYNKDKSKVKTRIPYNADWRNYWEVL